MNKLHSSNYFKNNKSNKSIDSCNFNIGIQYKKIMQATIFLTIVLFIVSVSCQKVELYSETRFLFSSYFELKVLTTDIEKTKKDCAGIFSEIEKLGNQIDVFKNDSFVSELNLKRTLEIPLNLREYISVNIEYINKTNGFFNPFIGDLLLEWNYFKENTIPPSSDKIKKILKNGFVFMFDKNKALLTLQPGVKVDFGGSSQGYLVDRVYVLLKDNGYENFLINCSGDIRVSGTNKGQFWKIGIKHPYKDGILATTTLKPDEAIVTSGNYERFFIYNGIKYFHILNPLSGYPDSDIDSLTIKYNNTLEADILSTALFAMGKTKVEEFSKKHNLNIFMIWLEKNNTMKYSNNNDYSITE